MSMAQRIDRMSLFLFWQIYLDFQTTVRQSFFDFQIFATTKKNVWNEKKENIFVKSWCRQNCVSEIEKAFDENRICFIVSQSSTTPFAFRKFAKHSFAGLLKSVQIKTGCSTLLVNSKIQINYPFQFHKVIIHKF